MNYIVLGKKSCKVKDNVHFGTFSQLGRAKRIAFDAYRTNMYMWVKIVEWGGGTKFYDVHKFTRECDRAECNKIRLKIKGDKVALWCSGCGDNEFLQRIPAPYGSCLLWEIRNVISKIEKVKEGKNG